VPAAPGTPVWTCEEIDGDIDEAVILPSPGAVIFTIEGHIPVLPASGLVVNTALVEAGGDEFDESNDVAAAGYQRCAPNFQSVAGDDEPRPHDRRFRKGFESPPVPWRGRMSGGQGRSAPPAALAAGARLAET
jgi:hypothetical protein